MKKVALIVVLVVILCVTSAHTFATPTTTQSEQVSTNNTETMEIDSLTPPSVDESDAALLMDMSSGRLLYGKNINKRVFPASTTKIMTGILAIEMGDFHEIVTATAEALAPITIYDSQIGILIGEKLSMEQLVNALLIPSANDAANVIAVHLAGSIDAFVELMNIKARELGMNNTHFENTCGMQDENHYTTASDLAILAQYAMKNETFRKIVRSSTYKIPPTNKCNYERNLDSTNLFLSSVYHQNPLCTGIKTGHTSKAGYCLVSSAEYEGMSLLAVVMGCKNENLESGAYSYTNSKALYDFGFKNYKNKVVATPGNIVYNAKVREAKNKRTADLTVDKTINALISTASDESDMIETKINLQDEIIAPITKDSVLGTISYYYKGTLVGTSKLIATNDVERSEFLHILNIIIKIVRNPFFFIPAILLLIILKKHRKKRRSRRRRRNIKINRFHT